MTAKSWCFFFNFLAKPYGMWDLSSPARDHICGPCFGSRVLLTGPPGKSEGLGVWAAWLGSGAKPLTTVVEVVYSTSVPSP